MAVRRMLFASSPKKPGRIFASVKLDLLETGKSIAARTAILMDFRMKVIVKCQMLNVKCQMYLTPAGEVSN